MKSAKGRGTRFYVYKLTADNGGARHIKGDLLSLAICKGQIRRTAKEGDWIFGFGGKSLDGPRLDGPRLIYIAKVTKRVGEGEYYKENSYKGRDDRIYRWENDQWKLKDHARYHNDKDHRDRDLGKKDRSNAVVLLSEEFRYYGGRVKKIDENEFPKLKELLDRLSQGHRVNLDTEVQQELGKLRNDVWEAHPNKKKLGDPTQRDRNRPCNRSEGNLVSARRIC